MTRQSRGLWIMVTLRKVGRLDNPGEGDLVRGNPYMTSTDLLISLLHLLSVRKLYELFVRKFGVFLTPPPSVWRSYMEAP